mmetsp:Transcript_60697/g.162132  ORF Transcript_60697/g.162132 Transcript_60697/m.162132 type:complete len:309 (+) Transcript_60697:658-1584(+)
MHTPQRGPLLTPTLASQASSKKQHSERRWRLGRGRLTRLHHPQPRNGLPCAEPVLPHQPQARERGAPAQARPALQRHGAAGGLVAGEQELDRRVGRRGGHAVEVEVANRHPVLLKGCPIVSRVGEAEKRGGAQRLELAREEGGAELPDAVVVVPPPAQARLGVGAGGGGGLLEGEEAAGHQELHVAIARVVQLLVQIEGEGTVVGWSHVIQKAAIQGHFNSEETIQQRQGELCRLLALRSIQVIFKMKFLKLLKESPNMLSWDSLFNDQISSDKKCCIRNLAGRALGVDKYVLIGTKKIAYIGAETKN